MLANPKISSDWNTWTVMVIAGLLIVLQNLLQFKSANHIEASVQGVVQKFRLIWVLIFGVMFLHEGFSWQKIAGTLLTVLAGLILVKKMKRPKSINGIVLTLASTFFYGLVIVLFKFLFESFNFQSLTFFIFFIPAVINLMIMPEAGKKIIKLMKEDILFVTIACILGAFANLAMNQALVIGEASRVIVIIEAFLVITLIGEHFVLKEKENTLIKCIAVSLVIAGAVLIKLAP